MAEMLVDAFYPFKWTSTCICIICCIRVKLAFTLNAHDADDLLLNFHYIIHWFYLPHCKWNCGVAFSTSAVIEFPFFGIHLWESCRKICCFGYVYMMKLWHKCKINYWNPLFSLSFAIIQVTRRSGYSKDFTLKESCATFIPSLHCVS